ncbi:hypothetical protein PR048_028459 [Dryococelus australis]|uniref:Reverse transcriptase/retrotransposon-derived protein RNase H-like domain-containing protein n=1 Tax=Dryococelus australis TaxID=614101 RepID=A0ABQ9GAN2_9NEOP|nr:hypothetical protein PR048_028459 [Dryococelus australis]
MSSFAKYDHSRPEAWTEHLERFQFWLDSNRQITDDKKRGLLILISIKNIILMLNPMVCYNKFVNRDQLPGEKAVVYMSELRRLASSYNFELCQFVWGLHNAGLQAELFSEKELIAMKALEVVQLVERCEQNAIEDRNSCVEDVHKFHATVSGSLVFLPPSSGSTFPSQKQLKVPKMWQNQTCYESSIQKLIMQILLTLSQLQLPPSEVHSPPVSPPSVDLSYLGAHASSLHNESLFLLSVRASSLNTKPYSVRVQVNKVLMQFEIDSDTYKPGHLYYQFTNSDHGPVLCQVPVGLRTWASQSLTIVGEFQAVVKCRHFTCKFPVLVVDGIGPNLLDRNWIQDSDIYIQVVNFLSPGTSNAGMSNEAFLHTIINVHAVSGHGTGCYKGPPLHVNINTAVAPVYQRARSVAFALTTKMKDTIVRSMDSCESGLSLGLATVLVLKYNSTLWVCADYRGTVICASSSGTCKSPTVDNLAGGCIYGTIHLEEAYTQIPMDEDASNVLTLNTVQVLHSFMWLPFGIMTACSAFQRIIDSLFGPVKGTTVAAYWARLMRILHILSDAGFKVYSEKRVWQAASIEVLGFRLDNEGIHPTNDKTAAITNDPRPCRKQELQYSLSLISFYGRFFKDRATILEPLHRFLDSKSKCVWTTKHQVSLHTVKDMLTSHQVLAQYNPDLPLVVTVNASSGGGGVGGVVVLAHIIPVKKFTPYLDFRRFTIITDHKPLLGIFPPDSPTQLHLSPRMLRYFDYELCHKPSTSVGHSDCLSKLP